MRKRIPVLIAKATPNPKIENIKGLLRDVEQSSILKESIDIFKTQNKKSTRKSKSKSEN